MKNLIGHTVRISSRDKHGITLRVVTIISEFIKDGTMYYDLQDVTTKKKFICLANRYDELFLTKRKKMLPKNEKGTIYNKSNPDFTK